MNYYTIMVLWYYDSAFCFIYHEPVLLKPDSYSSEDNSWVCVLNWYMRSLGGSTEPNFNAPLHLVTLAQRDLRAVVVVITHLQVQKPAD